MTFQSFFKAATEKYPYPYQERLAGQPIQNRLIHVPTGAGKTAAAILAWLWRRKTDPQNTPRRLVYCLPLRVLVEQTREKACEWVSNLKSTIWPEIDVTVNTLMGGEVDEDWELYPEKPAILVGTQDMLLSRALNRGYAMSRYRWPVHFGLFNNDCLWVCDEVQLMGSGLGTTTQLQGLREQFGVFGPSATWWMSATLQTDWLSTVDFDSARLTLVELEHDDLATEEVRKIREARKPLRATDAHIGDPDQLATEIVSAHKKASGRTLVVVNTVTRARELHAAVQRELKAAAFPIEPILIHSRFRPPDRKEHVERLLEEPGEHGMLVISTQVVEAGVDVSARTLFTELAPWSSLVQRFGRCNRRGSDNDTAQAFWIDLPKDGKQHENASHPYELADVKRSRDLLQACKDVSPASLEAIGFTQRFQHSHVIRYKDFIELFDTTPDLAGNNIDIDPYVREIEESDVKVFWREWPVDQPPPDEEPRPRREELCSAPIGEFRQFVKDSKRRRLAFRWDYLNSRWVQAEFKRISPGQIYLLHSHTGGYAPDVGWNVKVNKPVMPVAGTPKAASPPDANDDDALSESAWQSIAKHTDLVCAKLEVILSAFPLPESLALALAARWHDWGKAHAVFQKAVRANLPGGQTRPPSQSGRADIAKAPKGWWNHYERKHFRHELASALAVLHRAHDCLTALSEDDLNLIAYLIASHHGRVRLSIRSLPGEKTPPGNERFARGIWDGDTLPSTDLGGDVIAPAIALSMEPMELGLCEQPPFTGQPSWAERMLTLRDRRGPCRLAYLEAILRAADRRASMTSSQEEASHA